MTRRDFLCSVSSVPILTSLISERERGAAQSTHRLGSDKHLFLDDFLIAEKTNVTLTVNPPQHRELVIVADKPWERNGITSYCNVLYDENTQEYRLYYVPIHLQSNPIFRLAMATAKDGVHWDKPHLGAVEWQGSKENNIVIDGQREGTVMIDPNGAAEKRYVFLSSEPTLRTRLFTSPDGIRWTRYRVPYVPLYQHEELPLKIAMIFPGMLYHPDRIDQYFGGYTFTHGDTNARERWKGRELGGIFRSRNDRTIAQRSCVQCLTTKASTAGIL